MGGETTGMSGGMTADGSKRHSPREEDGTIKIVSGETWSNRYREKYMRCILPVVFGHLADILLP